MKILDADGNAYEQWTDGAGNTITELRQPVLVWDTPMPVSVAVNSPVTITGHLADFDGEVRTVDNWPDAQFELRRSKATITDTVALAVVDSVLTVTFATSVSGRYSLRAGATAQFVTARDLVITVTDTAPATIDPILPLVVSLNANAIAVALDQNDVSPKVRRNIYRQFVGGTALTQTDRDAVQMATAQKLGLS